MEYHPEWEPDYKPPMPKVKPPKDPKIEDDALLRIMQLAVYGAVSQATQESGSIFSSTEEVVKLFKEAGLTK